MTEHNKKGACWSYEAAKEFYCIDAWGNGYFDVSQNGLLSVTRGKAYQDTPVALLDIVHHAQKQLDIHMPLMLRFGDVIKSRVERINLAFEEAKQSLQYRGRYTLIYPIKVNQHRHVVSHVQKANSSVGLESGSKAELLAVLSMVESKQTPIVCNGYKDRDYIRTALMAKKMGQQIYIVIEKMIEAHYVIEESKRLAIQPLLGVRCRLALTLAGKWAHSGGEKSKFGLNTTQTLQLITLLKEQQLLENLVLIHCHQGSQIANLQDIHHYINELGRMFVQLHRMGAPLCIVDIGGGLAVDYEGSRTRSLNSKNYTLSEYAHCILSKIKELTDEFDIPAPDIFSESGRAAVAHHAVFITNIVEIESLAGEQVPDPGDSKDEDLLELYHMLDSFDQTPTLEVYSSSVSAIEHIHQRFASGHLSLSKRATAEQLFSLIKLETIKRLNPLHRSHRELYDALDGDLAKKVIANFSLFQSMPDSWAISQLFPVLPLSHLHQKPVMRAVIEDITCDSDGKIRHYTTHQGDEPSLKLPPFDVDQPYLIGCFLMGAYQEIMGNMHNLFAKVTTLDISLSGEGCFQIKHVEHGFDNQESLWHVNYNADCMLDGFQENMESSDLSEEEKKEYLEHFKKLLKSHSYLY